MKIILVRHGQTDANKNGILQGQEVDISLNETGIQQVEKSAFILAGKSINSIISSPLKRALQTAEIISRNLSKNIELDDRLKEFSYGSLAGKTWMEIEQETGDGAMREKDQNLIFNYHPYGGESIEDVKTRVIAFMKDVQTRYLNKSILITTHGGIIDVVHMLLPQKEKVEVDNATIHEFEV